ncbi:MAG TPA: GDP-mannose 4,6-dehydratase [Candidatus Paceibacterota bacterium]|nr:GDP-mannose 4,6-dehydratase [Candidatus Paceibacterota bacterium]
MSKKIALITGITGQDGSYLADLLLKKKYQVIGITSGKGARDNIETIQDRIEWVEGDLTNEEFVRNIVGRYLPDEIYNLASIATVAKPWEHMRELVHLTGLTPIYFLESIRTLSPTTHFFQASSSEMFGAVEVTPQDESTPLHPRNPYGAAKVFAHNMVDVYRSGHNIFAVSGILYNHESPRRPEHFVTRKITSTLAKISLGMDKNLSVGNLDARRDWGFSGDYVRAMHLSLQHEKAQDYVIASGTAHSVREFIEAACAELGIKISWEGEGLSEVGVDEKGTSIVTIAKEFYRPLELHILQGDASRARKELGWSPDVTFEDLVARMVRADIKHQKGLI